MNENFDFKPADKRTAEILRQVSLRLGHSCVCAVCGWGFKEKAKKVGDGKVVCSEQCKFDWNLRQLELKAERKKKQKELKKQEKEEEYEPNLTPDQLEEVKAIMRQIAEDKAKTAKKLPAKKSKGRPKKNNIDKT